MFCINCGHKIEDNAKFCSECGTTQQETSQTSTHNVGNHSNPAPRSTIQTVPYNTMCITGLVISGISLLLNFFGLVGIAGTIVSVIGLIDCEKKKENGKSLAVCGIIIGVFSIFYGLIAILTL